MPFVPKKFVPKKFTLLYKEGFERMTYRSTIKNIPKIAWKLIKLEPMANNF